MASCSEQFLNFMKLCSAVLKEQRIRDWDGRTNERTDHRRNPRDFYPLQLFHPVGALRKTNFNGYSAQSPECLAVSCDGSTTTTNFNGYSAQSPECLALSCDESTAATNSYGFSTVSLDGFTHVVPAGTFPLEWELVALSELVDCVRVDLLQTSMLVDHCKDFLKTYKF